LRLYVDGKRRSVSKNTVLFLPFVHHEVAPIHSGHRVSVLCRIYRPESAEAASPTRSTVRWLGTLVDTERLPLAHGSDTEGGLFGACDVTMFDVESAAAAIQALLRTTQRQRRLFLLAHNAYSASQMQHLNEPAKMLIGRDRDLWVRLCAQEDLRVWVAPAVRVEKTEFDTPSADQYKLGYFDANMLRAALKGPHLARTMPQHPQLAALFEPDARVDMAAHFKSGSADGFCLLRDHLDHIEFTGNESQEGYEHNLYYTVAIVVQQIGTPYHGEEVVRARVAAEQAKHDASVAQGGVELA